MNESLNREFGRGVDRLPHDWDDTRDRAGKNDVARFLRDQMRQHGVNRSERGVDVEVEHAIPLVRIPFQHIAADVGTGVGMEDVQTARKLEEKSLALYNFARSYAIERGIIIADTKFEFGFHDRELILIDEALTPDSSRFWDAGQYEPGQSQPSYDKQPVRDWLIASGWNQKAPVPSLPADVVEATTERYIEAFSLLTGRKFKNVFI